MSKCFLVMDMPSSCLECPLRYESEEISLGNFSYQKLFRCKCEPENISEDNGDIVFLNNIMMESKPDFCPLRKLPEKKNEDATFYDSDYYTSLGYNACIDELLKGEEG